MPLKRTSLANQRGQSIIQVLISVALMGIVMLAFASMMAGPKSADWGLQQKLAVQIFNSNSLEILPTERCAQAYWHRQDRRIHLVFPGVGVYRG